MSTPLPATFVDLLRLWQVDPVGYADTVLSEAAALVETQIAAGESDPTLEALVVEGPESSRLGFGRLVVAVQEAHGIEAFTGITAQDEAVAAAVRQYQADRITPRELTYWVTRVVGLRGGVRTQVFLDLEQAYCARLADDDVSDIDQQVSAASEGFLAGDAPQAGQGESRRRGLRGLFSRRE
ncbi:hypothetical protein [Nocardioides sp.]|uniref:hypothetical protein n=1 Tax=Nocardioides sp. TaxID=35761 RepID=UPI002631AAE2|nr:hypothetical protein [Nocardioides sp.]